MYRKWFEVNMFNLPKKTDIAVFVSSEVKLEKDQFYQPFYEEESDKEDY